MSFLHIALLAIVQGLAELLPVSSSAHVILVEKLLGLDPSTPEMVFLLVMLHTGTMFAVIVYFWSRWRAQLSIPSTAERVAFVRNIVMATIATGIIGYGLKKLIEKFFMAGADKAEIEQLFKNLPLIAFALACAGILILIAGRRDNSQNQSGVSQRAALWIGAVQGVCLPFRGFSRSGATISTSMLLGVSREASESFSFLLAVVLTPPVIWHSVSKLREAHATGIIHSTVIPGLIGLVLSFFAGLFALRFLSAMLEKGKWSLFGIYCLVIAALTLCVNAWVG